MSKIGNFVGNLGPVPKVIFVILLAVGFYFLFNSSAFKKAGNLVAPKGRQAESILDKGTKEAVKEGVPLVRVGVVTWGGYIGGEYFNGGFKASKESRYYTDYKMLVEFKVLDDFQPSRDAWKANQVDALWVTADAFCTETGALNEYGPMLVFQADWSRGGDAIVVKHEIATVADLKHKKVAVALGTPSHTFLLSLLQAAGMEYGDIEVIGVPSAVDAATRFKSGQVDAAVVWSPDDDDCVKNVVGSRVLKSTREATNIIADGFFVKKAYLEAHKTELVHLYEGWMKGAAEINSDPAAKEKAVKILAAGLNIDEAVARNAINNVRLTTHGDNLNFFGTNPSYSGVTGENLYTKMAGVYARINLISGNVPPWRNVATSEIIKAANLTGPGQEAEAAKSFKPATVAEAQSATAYASKVAMVSFASNSAALDQNAKVIIDMSFADEALRFANSRVRIVGHTDNRGSAAANRALSEKRAQSLKDYLVTRYRFDPNRFLVEGKGPDQPIADNGTEDGRAKNRRTEFQLLN